MESAYERVPETSARACAVLDHVVSNECHDHEGVLRLLPKRFTGEFALLELIWALEAAFGTNDEALMRNWPQRLPRAIDQAELPADAGAASASAWQSSAPGKVRGTTLSRAAESAQECSGFVQSAVGCHMWKFMSPVP